MATISIPERVLPEYKIISELNNAEIDKVIEFVNSFNVGEDLETLAN